MTQSDQLGDLLTRYDFVLCYDIARLQQASRIRKEVFVEEQGFSSDADPLDPHSAHFLLEGRNEKGKAIAVLRLTPSPTDLKVWKGDAKAATATTTDGPSSSPDGQAELTSSEYPLGKPLSPVEIARRFMVTVHGQGPSVEEEEGVPPVRGASISRVAVDRAYRGQGLGTLLCRQAEQWLQQVKRQAESQEPFTAVPSSSSSFGVLVDSTQDAVPFFERLGYSIAGDPDQKGGKRHKWCIKMLTGSPNVQWRTVC